MRCAILCAAIALTGACADAQSPPSGEIAERDRATIFECVQANAPDETACRGRVATPCLEAPGGDTTTGMIVCTSRETRAWDALLNARYGQQMTSYSASVEDADLANMMMRQSQRLRDSQRAWITLRDADCAYEAGRFEGGTIARVIAATCLLDHTADRAIWLAPRREGG